MRSEDSARNIDVERCRALEFIPIGQVRIIPDSQSDTQRRINIAYKRYTAISGTPLKFLEGGTMFTQNCRLIIYHEGSFHMIKFIL